MSEIYAELFDEMELVRQTLIERYAWFTHDTPADNLDRIKKSGLRLKSYHSCPSVVIAHRGELGREIVCLHPMGSKVRPASSGWGPFMRLAVPSDALPSLIGLDWSYDWNIANDLRILDPLIELRDVVLQAVLERGSIVSYSPIAPEHLKIWSKNQPDDPWHWNKLTDVDAKDIHQFL